MSAAITQCAKHISVLVALVILSGCVWTPHDLQLHATTQPTASDIGQGTRLFFRFIDDRDDTTIGHRGVATVGAKISAADLPSVFEARLRDSLEKKQFQLVGSDQDADASITYRLRSFKFDIEQGFWTGGSNAAAALAVDADRKGHTYANVYRYNSEERIFAVPGGDAIDGQMNAAMNDLLRKADADTALDQLLAGR